MVVEDDEENYIAGSRPDWAKASTHITAIIIIVMVHTYIYLDTVTLAVQQESSLEEMQKKALYISQDIIRGFQEIGEGILYTLS